MDFYLGQIILFAGTFAPVGWKLCDGSLLPISQNDALFSLLGTTYGGDGVNTFALPDLRGAVPLGPGQAPGRSGYVQGQTGGTENVTVTSAQLPGHTHPIVSSAVTLNVTDGAADSLTPKGSVFANTGQTPIYAAADNGVVLNPGFVTGSVPLSAAGGNQPLSVRMPYLAMNYCICTEGIYPSQN
jgi:microcystin-dependent protein